MKNLLTEKKFNQKISKIPFKNKIFTLKFLIKWTCHPQYLLFVSIAINNLKLDPKNKILVECKSSEIVLRYP